MKIKFEDNDFVVNGARLKKYVPSVLVQIFRKPEEDILVNENHCKRILRTSPMVIGTRVFISCAFITFVYK